MTPLIGTAVGLAFIADSGERPGLALLGGALIVCTWIWQAWAVEVRS